MDNKMMGQLFGALLIVIAIILAAVQHYNMYNFYGDVANKWYFWGLTIIIGVVGIILVAWSFMKKTAAPAT